MNNFAAIDFETANEQPCSVCSVGVVVVRGGEIVDSFYSLIKPEPEYYRWFCQRVHGLGPADTDQAPVFPQVWRQIAPRFEGLPLVAHNARFDEGCLKAVFRVYQMDRGFDLAAAFPAMEAEADMGRAEGARLPGFTISHSQLTAAKKIVWLP